MPFKIRFDDITTYKADVVVNSLGIDGRIYGKLCQSIIDRANSEELKSFIDSKTNNKVGQIFVSEAYGINAKKIFHVVSPFCNDDANNKNLINTYKSIFTEVIKQGYKSVAVPFLGTGANGYSDREAHDAFIEACNDIIDKEEETNEDILDISLIVADHSKKKNQFKNISSNNEIMGIEFRCIKLIKNHETRAPRIIGRLKRCLDAMTFTNENEILFPTTTYKFPYDFVDDYIAQKNIDEKILRDSGLDRKVKYKMRNSKKLDKLDIYRLAFVLKMNKPTTVEFMVLCGYSFNPLDKLDMFFLDFLDGKYKNVGNLTELSWISSEKCGKELLW